MLPSKLAFVDIETTGMRAFYDRVIEIGILRVEDNVVTQKYHSLIDPQSRIPPEITRMTGITTRDLEGAPTFRQIKDEILDTLNDCILVAHNVRFDYGFLKNEFKRLDYTFTKKHLCTVRLSRALFPQHRHHNLDSLIERFGFACVNRHRAMDDAKILYSFYKKILLDFPTDQIAKAIHIGLKKPTIPLGLKTDLDKIPEKPGVYIFYGKSENKIPPTPFNKGGKKEFPSLLKRGQGRFMPTAIPLYIGKSVNLHDRVLSHFSSDLRSPIEMKISQQIESIETIITTGEMGALILESQLIKKILPLYNQKSRIKHELIALIKETNKDGYDTIKIETLNTTQLKTNFSTAGASIPTCSETVPKYSSFKKHSVTPLSEASALKNYSNRPHPNPLLKGEGISLDSVLGLFRSRKQAKIFLAEITKEFNLCEKLLGLEKTNKECFAYRLGKCKGACIRKEKPIFYNLKFITAFSASKIKPWPFSGPILIEETDGYAKEYFLINKWCYLKNIKIDSEGNKNKIAVQNPTFDLDIYKILIRYLSQPQNLKNVKPSALI